MSDFSINIIESKPKELRKNTKIKYLNGSTYEYEEYKLVDQSNPILKEKLVPFDFATAGIPAARNIAVSLIEAMREHNGVGLAANQVGLSHRVFVIGSQGSGNNAVAYAFFNPEIVEVTGEERFNEGCLTFPGLFLPIKRPATVKIKYQDMDGVAKEETFTGLSARIILHEYDHLDGMLMTEKVHQIVLDRCKQKVKKNLKLLEQQRLQQRKQDLIAAATQKVILAEKKKMQMPEELNENQEVAPPLRNSLIIKTI